jgi:hypothetical protein
VNILDEAYPLVGGLREIRSRDAGAEEDPLMFRITRTGEVE